MLHTWSKSVTFFLHKHKTKLVASPLSHIKNPQNNVIRYGCNTFSNLNRQWSFTHKPTNNRWRLHFLSAPPPSVVVFCLRFIIPCTTRGTLFHVFIKGGCCRNRFSILRLFVVSCRWFVIIKCFVKGFLRITHGKWHNSYNSRTRCAVMKGSIGPDERQCQRQPQHEKVQNLESSDSLQVIGVQRGRRRRGGGIATCKRVWCIKQKWVLSNLSNRISQQRHERRHRIHTTKSVWKGPPILITSSVPGELCMCRRLTCMVLKIRML